MTDDPRRAAPPASIPVPDRGEARRPDELMGAALDLTAQLDLQTLLMHLVDRAARLTGARFAALGVLDARGDTTAFVHTGVSEGQARLMPHPPRGLGIFTLIPSDGYVILEDLMAHPAFEGFPPGHPPMHAFLGVPVRIRGRVYGRLYLTDKPGGFTSVDAERMMSLAGAAGVAIENSRIHSASRTRERWLEASQQITTALLEGTDEEEALGMIAERVREVAEADTSVVVLPSVGDTWAAEIADGHRADELLGVVFPRDGRAMNVLRAGVGMMVDSLDSSPVLRVEQLRGFGPALYAPMMLRGSGTGVLLLLRRTGRPEFDEADLAMAESLAAQAALALELASARHAQDVQSLLEERGRISRDLHDLVVQQLFATGMELETARTELADGGETAERYTPVLERALASIDDSVTQIRAIVHDLREPDATVDLVERLRREASLSRNSLGFAPSLLVSVDGEMVAGEEGDFRAELVAERVNGDIADDVVAVVRECLSNAARHARASSVRVAVTVTGRVPDGTVCVEVTDDGVGVDPSVARRSGLSNLTVRARRHGGTFTIRPARSGRGSEATWRVPLS